MSKTPPYSGLGAKPFLAPPAKADIATAILTNVIEHLVLLLPPNKHAFTAKAVWADLQNFLVESRLRADWISPGACSGGKIVAGFARLCALRF